MFSGYPRCKRILLEHSGKEENEQDAFSYQCVDLSTDARWVRLLNAARFNRVACSTAIRHRRNTAATCLGAGTTSNFRSSGLTGSTPVSVSLKTLTSFPPKILVNTLVWPSSNSATSPNILRRSTSSYEICRNLRSDSCAQIVVKCDLLEPFQPDLEYRSGTSQPPIGIRMKLKGENHDFELAHYW
jgi:hypothetical protein